MTFGKAIGTMCGLAKGTARRALLAGLGVTAVVVENVLDVVENAGPYTEKLIERGEKASEEIGEAYEQRRQELRQRAQANGHAAH